MPAGPELDRLVAEKVMGWTRRENDLGQPYGIKVTWHLPNGVMAEFEDDDGRSAFCPSERIDHAWQVVEKLWPEGDFILDRVAVDLWRAGGSTTTDDGARVIDYWKDASGDTAPLAICRAALKGVVHGN